MRSNVALRCFAAITLAAVIVLAGCGGGTTDSNQLTPISPSSSAPAIVSVSPIANSQKTDCGDAWVVALDRLSRLSSSQKVDQIQVVSWNDYESGSQIEAGVDNCLSITPTVTDTTLAWDVTGNAASVDHYAVYDSTDGVNLTQAASIASDKRSLDLASLNLSPDSDYTFIVQAVGRPSVLNKISAPVILHGKAKLPTVTVSALPLSGIAPLATVASLTATAATGHIIASQVIDFGDGTSADAASASHTYAAAGAYTLTATATDDLGQTATAVATVNVSAPTVNQPPLASLSVTPNSGNAPLTVNASTAASTDPDGTIASSTIDFGDGTIVNGSSASHVYNAAGTYTVKGTVTDNAGLSSSDSKTVSATAAVPDLQVAVTPSDGVVNGAAYSSEYVYPGATRSFFSRVTGSTNVLVNWSASCGTPASATGVTYFDWTAPNTAQTCKITATSQADASKSATSTVTVLPEAVSVNVIPFYLVLYKGQYADLQSYVSGTSTANADVTWTISGPSQGTTIGSITDRDLAWYSNVAGTYTITATSVRDNTKRGSATVIVTDHPMPAVTANGTQPVDCTCVGSGRCIDIGGNGSKYNAIGDWFAAGNTLSSGDTLRIWNKGTPYHEQLIIGGVYSATQPVRVCGVPDATGNLPEINGTNATAANPKDPNWVPGTYTMQQYGLVVVRNTNYYSAPPQYIVIEGLKINQAQNTDSYIAINTGTPTLYSSRIGASCIRVQNGEDVVIRGNELARCGSWGIFTNAQAPEGKMVRRVTVEGNYLHDNATPKNYSMHNAYIQSDGAVIQFNYFGHAIPGAIGSTLKTRSAGIYVRYNHLLAEQRLLDFVEPQDAGPYFYTYIFKGQTNHDVRDTISFSTIASTEEHLWNVYAYGNTLWTGNGYCQSCIHYGWDMLPNQAQGGTMWFYYNTLQAAFTYPGGPYGWTLWDEGNPSGNSTLPATFPHAQIVNNVIYRNPASAKGSPTFFEWAARSEAIGVLGKNWIDANWGTGNSTPGFGSNCSPANNPATWQNSSGLCNIANVDAAHLVQTGTTPVDATTYAPGIGSAIVGAAEPLPAGLLKLSPKFSLSPATRLIAPRSSVADLGAVPKN